MALQFENHGPKLSPNTDIQLPNTPGRRLQLAQRESLESIGSSFGEKAVYFVPHAILSMADTFAETLSFGLVGDQDLEEWMAKHGGSFGRAFNENRSAVGAVGDIAGAFIPGMLAMKALRQGSRFAKLAEAGFGPGAKKFFSTGLSNTVLFEKNFQAARTAGAARVTDIAKSPGFTVGRKKAIGRSVADTVIEGVGADIAIALTMNESEFLFPEEFSLGDHLAFFAGTNLAIGGVAGLIARRTFKRGADTAIAAGKATAQTPADLALQDGMSNIVGERGNTMALQAQVRDETASRTRTADAAGDQQGLDAARAEETAVTQRIGEIAEAMLRDSPIEGVTHSVNLKKQPGKGIADNGEIRTIIKATEIDPNMSVGARSFENLDSNARIGFEERLANKIGNEKAVFKTTRDDLTNLDTAIEKRGAAGPTLAMTKKRNSLINKSEKLRTSIDDLEGHTAIAIELDGSTTALAGRAEIFQDGPREIGRKSGTSIIEFDELDIVAHGNGQVSVGGKLKDLEFSIGDDFKFIDPKGAAKTIDFVEFAKLTHMQKTGLSDALQDRVNKINLDTVTPMTVPDDAHFSQLDFLVAAIGKHGDEFTAKIANFTSIEDLQFRSLQGKFAAYQELRNSAATARGLGQDHIYENLGNVSKALNLAGDNSAILRFFEQSRIGTDDLKTLVGTMDGLKEAIRVMDDLPVETTISNEVLSGSMLNLPFENKPVMAVMRNVENRAGLQTGDLAAAVAIQRSQMAERLRAAPNSIFVKALMDTIDGNPEAVLQAKKELAQVIQGNQSEGVISRNLVQQNFRFRDEPAFNQFDFITDLADKAVDNHIERILNPAKFGAEGTNHRQVFNAVLNRGAEGDMQSFHNGRHAYGAGWDLADNMFVPTNGKNGEVLFNIQLKSTARNKDIWRRMFPGQAFPEGDQVMMPMTGQREAIAVTEKAMLAMRSFNELDQQLFTENAALRHARNLPPLKRKNFHMPPKDMSGKEVAYLIDKAGHNRGVVSANTQRELTERVEKELKLSNETMGVASSDTMERFHNARFEAYHDMTDMSKLANQTGPATGKSFNNTIDSGPEAFKQMIESTIRQFTDIGRQTRLAVFEPEVQYLKLQKAASGAGDKRTIYDELISRIAGVQNIDSESVVGRSLLHVETVYDRMLQTAFNEFGGFSNVGLSEYKSRGRYAKMEERFAPEHLPFRDFTDYMERTEQVKMPGSLRKHAAALNEITTALTIRMFDIGMGVINIISLASTLPPVIAMTARRIDETLPQWQARVGAYGVVTPGGNAYFSPAKAVTDGTHFMFSDEGRAVAKRAADAGFFDQFAAEQVEIFGRTGEGFVTGLLRSFANKTSFITDKTERGSRAFAFMTFYNMGRKGLGLEDRAAMAFAHRQANNTIADFRPSNRPAIFQGAAGMPLGLFTTFMWNYMQRFVGLAETLGAGSGKAAAIQVGLQSSLFGAESLPGWQQFTDTFMDNYDGSTSVVDRLNDAFGHAGADVFLNGTVANLPKMFGAEDGISIGPRASVGLPFQSGFGAQSIAGVRLIQRGGQTLGKILDDTIQNRGIDPMRVAEIIAASNINKGLSHAIELGITNESQDHTGSIIEPDVSLGMNIETGARMLGFKPLMADELRQENRRNRATDRTRAELKARLASSLRSKIRGGRLDNDDVEDSLESYSRAGGNPESFRRYFQSQILRGTTSKIDSEIADALRDSADTGRLGRLLYLSRD